MKAADTSVVVAAFASWHEYHDRARDALDRGLRNFLRTRFVEPFLRMDSRPCKDFVLALPEHFVTGGGVYDALVAATAAPHAASLVTCDRRAALVY